MIALVETPHCRGVAPLPHTLLRSRPIGRNTLVLGRYEAGGFFLCAVRDDGRIAGTDWAYPDSAHADRLYDAFNAWAGTR